MAKMKKANVPVGYLRTVEQGLNAPEVRGRDRLSQIAHPTAGSVPNIEPPIQLAMTPAIDPVAAPLLGQHTKAVLHKTLGYDDARIARAGRGRGVREASRQRLTDSFYGTRAGGFSTR